MAKKRTSAKPKAKQNKKAAQPEATNEVAVDEAAAEVTAATVSATAVTTSTTGRRRANRMIRQQVRTLALEEEYAYVVKDLRRVFILGGIMFVGLIAVNLAFTLVGGG